MSPSNIEQEITRILRKKDGWLRTEQCAKEYAKGDETKRTSFYRWYRRVEKGEVRNFQVLKFPGNVSFIGLKSANPKIIETLISEDEKAKLNGQLLHESTKAQAINELRTFEALTGYTFSQDEWQYVLSAATDKEMRDRCNALLKLKRLRSLL